jgi:hypothetical protein
VTTTDAADEQNQTEHRGPRTSGEWASHGTPC